jgi:DNA integrity scanning protein DisA with diadenylate cyclase activity
MIHKIEKTLIDVAIKICKQHKGCIFVIMHNQFDYAPLIEQDVKPFSIFDNLRRVEALALLDGACIINPKGEMIAYAVQILNTKPFGQWGTRHAGGATASQRGNITILSSEEDYKVRVFKDGKLIMQIDALERNIESRTSEAVSLLESIGVGTLGTIGIGIIAPGLGLALIPGVLIFGTTHYLSKQLFDHINGRK